MLEYLFVLFFSNTLPRSRTPLQAGGFHITSDGLFTFRTGGFNLIGPYLHSTTTENTYNVFWIGVPYLSASRT